MTLQQQHQIEDQLGRDLTIEEIDTIGPLIGDSEIADIIELLQNA